MTYECVRVVVRVRPSESKTPCVLKSDKGGLRVMGKVGSSPSETPRLSYPNEFHLDTYFDESNDQESIFTETCLPLIDGFFSGINGTVLAYGQTASGKTYTVGSDLAGLLGDDSRLGIIARMGRELFSKMSVRKERCSLMISLLEVYRDDIFDLFAETQSPLPLRENPNGPVVTGLLKIKVSNISDFLKIVHQGLLRRSVGSTKMNDRSSRSHCVLSISLDSGYSKLCIVDLAGSERLKKTFSVGTSLKESVAINSDLLSLGNVIAALTENFTPRGHIPYRDSKLTRLLQDSLGGTARTVLIACLSSRIEDSEETLNTLRWASRATKITNNVKVESKTDSVTNDGQIVQKLKSLISAVTISEDPICRNLINSIAEIIGVPIVANLSQTPSPLQLAQREIAHLKILLHKAEMEKNSMTPKETISLLATPREELASKKIPCDIGFSSFANAAALRMEISTRKDLRKRRDDFLLKKKADEQQNENIQSNAIVSAICVDSSNAHLLTEERPIFEDASVLAENIALKGQIKNLIDFMKRYCGVEEVQVGEMGGG